MTDPLLRRRILFWAGLSGAAGVLVGAFGAHGMESFLASRGLDAELISKRLDQFDVGVRYHLIHSVALLGLASASISSASLQRWTARLFLVGLCLFSGSLYLLVLTNTPVLGAITPIGGLCWIAGWLLLAFAATQSPDRASQAPDRASQAPDRASQAPDGASQSPDG